MIAGLKIPVGVALLAVLALAGLLGVFAFNAAPPAQAQQGTCVEVGDDLECTYPENGTGRVYDFHAVDPDRAGVVIWERVTDATDYPDHGDFEIDRMTGVLTFKNTPNFEGPADDGGDNTYKVKVKAGDGATTFKDVGVTVTVTNVEEAGTVTLKNLQPQVRTDLGYNMPDDEDGNVSVSGQQWARSRSMTDGYANIVGATGATYSPKNDDVGYYLRVTVTYVDGMGAAHDTAMASSMYPVRALPDEGNKAPVFFEDDDLASEDARTASREIDENSPVGSKVGPPVVATDGNLDVLTYSLGGTDDGRFSIDQVTGQIMTKAKLNFESAGGANDSDNCATANTCSVTVTATDPSGATGESTVAITVNDVNEAPSLSGVSVISHPELSGDPLAGTTVLDTDLSNATPDAATYEATATDTVTAANALPASTVRVLTLEGPDASKFNIGSASDATDGTTPGTLAFKANPDFEKPGDKNGDNIYEVTVVATDLKWATKTKDVTIKVTNVEETGSVELSHTQPEVETPIRATLDDPDGGTTGIRYQWHRNSTEPTALTDLTDATEISGAISASYTPVGDDATNYLAVKVTYTDKVRNVDANDIPNNEPEMIFGVSETTVRAKVNPNPRPYFVEDGAGTDPVTRYTRYVLEELDAGAAVILAASGAASDADSAVDGVAATDVDDDTGATDLVHTLAGPDKAYFSLNTTQGLVTKKKLDYETRKRYSVTVTATDPSGGSATVTVTINVVNDDEAPEIDGPTRMEYMENGTAPVASYTGTDPEGKAIVWTVLGGDGGDATVDVEDFKVTSKSGGSTMLAFKDSPNYETMMGGTSGTETNTYTVQLRAAVIDADDPPTGMQLKAETIMVRVTDVPEAPEFPTSTVTLSVKETTTAATANEVNTGANADIGAPEAAEDSDGDTLTYSLGGADADSFNIIPANGRILRKDPLDYETKDMYEVTVTATDPSGLSDTVDVTIEVLDVPEKPTITDGLTVSGSDSEAYAENGTGAVGTYTVEGNVADSAVWTLEGDDAAHFSVSAETGATTDLMFSSAPNYEMPRGEAKSNTNANTYMVTVKAADPDDASIIDSIDVTVTVTDMDEAGMVTLTPASPVAGMAVSAELSDPDAPVNVTTWQWSKSMTSDGTFTDISGATAMSYTPVADDVGYYLMATAAYMDKHGSGKSAMAKSASMVVSADPVQALINRFDDVANGGDGDGELDRSELIAAIQSYLGGDSEISRSHLISLIGVYLSS